MRHTLPLLSLLVSLMAMTGCNSLRIGTPAPDLAPTAAPVPPLAERWTRSVDAAFGAGAPLVLGDQLLVGTRKGDVVLLNAATGRIEGRQSFGDSVEGSLAFSDDRRLLFVPIASPARITAQDIVRGVRAWRWKARDLGSPDAGVVQAGGVVVAPLTDGTVIGLDAADGSVRWQIRHDSTASFLAAPLIADGRVIVVDDRGTVRRLDPRSGQTDWTMALDAPVEHTPALTADGALIVVTTRGEMVRVEPGAARATWRASLADGERVPPRVGPPSFHPGAVGAAAAAVVIAGATNGRLSAFDAATGAVVWSRDFDAHVNSAPLVSGAFVFVGTTDQRVLGLDLATGETRWEAPIRGRVKSGLAAADGLLFVLTEPRHVVAFGPPQP